MSTPSRVLLDRLIDVAASRDPEAIAIRCDGTTLRYGQLFRRSNGLAHVLRQTGLESTDRVAVLLAKGPDVPVAFYGVFAAGGVLVPIAPRSPVEHVIRILRATGATHLITEPAKHALVEMALQACPEVAHVVGLEPDDLPFSCIPWPTVLDAASGRAPAVEVSDLDPAYILHTSGSTGLPKLILHTHSSAVSFIEWAVGEYSLTPDDRLSNHSSHHTCFSTFDYFAAARVGASTVILTQAALMMPASLSALLERERVSVWYSVPTALVQLSIRGDLEGRDLHSIRWVLFAGEVFPEKYLRRLTRQLPGARFSHVYGSTETNVCAYYHLPETRDPRSPLPIGKACPNSRTRVVDDELQPVPDGDVGELLVQGSTVMSAYWGDPELSARSLVQPPWDGGCEGAYFRTGDRARVLEDGNLAFVTRADLQVKVRGYRVELEEIESSLMSLDPVEEAAAFAVPDGEGSSSLRAAVVVRDSSASTRRKLLGDLRSLLPPYAIPAELTELEALPRTPTGKVDRNALQDRVAERDGGHGD